MAVFPPLLLAACIHLFGVEVLIWDEWFMWSGLLREGLPGWTDLQQLAAQHNEQRILTSRLVELALYAHDGAGRATALWLNYALAATLFFLCGGLHAGMRASSPDTALFWPLAAFSMLFFSTMQWETFTIGFNNQLLAPSVCICATALLLNGHSHKAFRTGAILFLGTVSSFSFSAGLLFWPALAAAAMLKREWRGKPLVLFIFAGAACWLLYFHDYSRPGHHPGVLQALLAPLETLHYALAWLGGALWAVRPLPLGAEIAGGAGLVILFWSLWGICRQPDKRNAAARWAAPLLFALLTCAATAAGRSGFGVEQAMESRYASFSNIFWAATLSLAALRLNAPRSTGRWRTIALAAFASVWLLSSVLSVAVMYNRAQRFETARQALFDLTDETRLEPLFPDTRWLVDMLPRFARNRVAMYRDMPQLRELKLQWFTPSGITGKRQETRTPAHGARVCVSGFAPGAESVLTVRRDTVLLETPCDAQGRFALCLPGSFFEGATLYLYARKGALMQRVHGGAVHPPQRTAQQEYTVGDHFYPVMSVQAEEAKAPK